MLMLVGTNTTAALALRPDRRDQSMTKCKVFDWRWPLETLFPKEFFIIAIKHGGLQIILMI